MLDESGWTNLCELGGGTGSSADAHTTKIRVDWKEAVGGESGSVVFDQSGASGAQGMMERYTKGAGTTWDIATATGTDDTHGLNRSVTASSSLDFAPGDVLVAFAATDTDTTPGVSGTSFNIPGATWGGTTVRTASAGVTTGLDGGIYMFECTIQAGSATVTVAPTLNFNTTVNQCGPIAFVRLREVSGATQVEATMDAQLGFSSSVDATPTVEATASASFGGTFSVAAARVVDATLSAPFGGSFNVTATPQIPATLSGALGFSSTVVATPQVNATMSASFGGTEAIAATVVHPATLVASFGGTFAVGAGVTHPATFSATFGFSASMAATPSTPGGVVNATLAASFGGTFAVSATITVPVTASASFGGSFAAIATVTVPASMLADLGFSAAASADAAPPAPPITVVLSALFELTASMVAGPPRPPARLGSRLRHGTAVPIGPPPRSARGV